MLLDSCVRVHSPGKRVQAVSTLSDVWRRRHLWAAVTAGALWIGWTISLLLGQGPFDAAGQIVGTDWIQFHTAGLTVLRSEGAHLYDLVWQHELQESVLGAPSTRLHAFLNPPFTALGLAPFAKLPYLASFAAWSLAGIGFLLVGFRLFSGRIALTEVGVALSFFPVFASVSFGQNGLLSLALFGCVWASWKRGRPWIAGLCASLLLYKPQLLVGVLLLWLLRLHREWRTLAGFALGSLLLVATSWVVLPEASRAYAELAIGGFPSLMTIEGFPLWHAHHLRSFWYMVFPGLPALVTVLWLVSSAALVLGFVRLVRRASGDRESQFSAAIVLGLLVTPHALVYDWVVLLGPYLLLRDRVLPDPRFEWEHVVVAVWVSLLIAGPLAKLQLGLFGGALQVTVPVLTAAAFLVFSNGRPDGEASAA